MKQIQPTLIATEHDEQQALFNYCHGYGGNLDNRLRNLHVIANGAWKGQGRPEAGMAESAGVPDMFLAVPTALYNGLYIELKRADGGQLSTKQRQWAVKLRGQGYAVEVCKGFDEAKGIIHNYLNGDLPPF